MSALYSEVSDAVDSLIGCSSQFDPWRAEWLEVEKFYSTLGLDISGLSSEASKDHQILLPASFFKKKTNLSSRSIPLHRVNRNPPLPCNHPKLILLKRRILRKLAVLILYGATELSGRRGKKSRTTKTSGYKWNTFQGDAIGLCELARVALIRGEVGIGGECPDGVPVFKFLSLKDLNSNCRQRVRVYGVHNRLQRAVEKGKLDDWICVDISHWNSDEIRKEKSRQTGVPLKPRGQNENEPFEDSVLGEVLETCLKLSEMTHDAILLARGAAELRRLPRRIGVQALRDFISKFNGDVIKNGQLPFPYFAKAKVIQSLADHPAPFPAVRALVLQVQIAHMMLLDFFFMMRTGEVESIPFDSLKSSSGDDFDYLTAKFFKNALQYEGVDREWPVAPIAATIILRQQEIKRTFLEASDPADSLWVGTGWNTSTAFGDFWTRWVHADGTRKIPEQSMAPTRFRSSAARMLVLAELGGDNLARLFMGHRDLEITRGYANAHGNLYKELAEIRTVVARAIGSQTLEDYDNETLSSRAREDVASTVSGFARFLSDEGAAFAPGPVSSADKVYGSNNVEDLKLFLGSNMKMTAPGVYCSRQGDQVGACRDAVHLTNPGRCNERKHCMYRRETGAYFSDQASRIEGFLVLLERFDATSEREDFEFYHIIVGLLDCFYHMQGEVARLAGDNRVVKAINMIGESMFRDLTSSHREIVVSIKSCSLGDRGAA